jgi:hypothetical protein
VSTLTLKNGVNVDVTLLAAPRTYTVSGASADALIGLFAGTSLSDNAGPQIGTLEGASASVVLADASPYVQYRTLRGSLGSGAVVVSGSTQPAAAPVTLLVGTSVDLSALSGPRTYTASGASSDALIGLFAGTSLSDNAGPQIGTLEGASASLMLPNDASPWVQLRRLRGTAGTVSVAASGMAVANGSARYAAQATWYIDGQNTTGLASDGNSGASAGAPLLTWAEYRRRVGSLPVATSTINLLSSLSTSDPIRPPYIPVGALVIITGTPGATSLYTSASGFTSVTAQNAASNTPCVVTDTALSANWGSAGPGGSSLIGQRILVTSGARAGAISWSAKDTGTKGARVVLPQIPSLVPTLPFGGFPGTAFANSDVFQVQSLPYAPDLVFDAPIASDSRAQGSGLVIEGISFYDPTFTDFCETVIPDAPGPAAIRFIGCNMGFIQGSAYYHACLWPTGQNFQSGVMNLFGCLIIGSCVLDTGCTFVPNQSTMIQCSSSAGVILHGSTIYGTDLAVFDSNAHGLDIRPGATVTCAAGTALWGSGHAAYGIILRGPGSRIGWSGTAVPTITGTSGDLLVGNTAKTWAGIGASGFTATNTAAAWVIS